MQRTPLVLAAAQSTMEPQERLTRSALIAARRAETGAELQQQYDVWADRNPVWAPRVAGPEAAAALGYVSGGVRSGPATRKEMMLERKKENLKIAVASSGFDQDTQAAICSVCDQPELVTNLVRDAVDPTVAWVEKPRFASRTELREHNKQAGLAHIDAALAKYARDGHMGAQACHLALTVTVKRNPNPHPNRNPDPDPSRNRKPSPDLQARSDMRVDQSIQAMFEAGGGATRSGLLASRRRQRMDEVEAAAELHGHAPVPQFAEQPAPFWHVGQPGSAAAARADGTNTRRAMSSEQLKSDQRWFAKPEQYPVVSPAEPRADDAFKLSAAEKRFLTRKLSSGPKRAQRGYPPELVALTEKVTAAPAPALPARAQTAAVPGKRAAVRPQRFSEMVFRFLPPEERMDAGQGPQTDGLQFTRPLYSSFTKSGIFEEPRGYSPPGAARGGAERPATVAEGQRRGRPGGGRSAPAGITGGGLGLEYDHGRPASKEAMRMSSLLGQGARGKPPAGGVRSGGFQLLPQDAPSRQPPEQMSMRARSYRPASVQ